MCGETDFGEATETVVCTRSRSRAQDPARANPKRDDITARGGPLEALLSIFYQHLFNTEGAGATWITAHIDNTVARFTSP